MEPHPTTAKVTGPFKFFSDIHMGGTHPPAVLVLEDARNCLIAENANMDEMLGLDDLPNDVPDATVEVGSIRRVLFVDSHHIRELAHACRDCRLEDHGCA